MRRHCTNHTRQGQEKTEFDNALEEVLQSGAKQLLQLALENEVAEYVKRYQEKRNEKGHQQIVRNGYHHERKIITGIGPVEVRQPRVHDKSKEEAFYSRILPRYMRRIASVDNLIPALYLKGISTGAFSTALEAILGKNAPGLSATNIVRLKQVWEKEYKDWTTRSLKEKHYVYFWVDGIYFNVRLEDHRQCMLIIIGATAEGKKELIAIMDGYRESKESWSELLRDIKSRGLSMEPQLAIGDGALGFWAALREVYTHTQEQRCWVHKTANILDKMPKVIQVHAKPMIHEMYMAPTKEEALKAYDQFMNRYEAKYPRACECLEKDKDVLFTFYDFPAKHWIHIRTTNPIESTFATVRLRTKRTKGCGSRMATLTMVYKLVQEAEKTWKRLKGYDLIPLVLEGKRFIDGELQMVA